MRLGFERIAKDKRGSDRVKGSLIGHGKLLELFPNFKDDIQENGIDLRVGKIEAIKNDGKIIGCIDDEKFKPDYFPIPLVNDSHYRLLPQNFYFVTCDRAIHIPDGYTQIYQIRSSFARCGLILLSSVGDNGFNGTLMMGLYNASPLPIFVGKNERIIQALTFKNDGSATEYSGAYQNDDFYKE